MQAIRTGTARKQLKSCGVGQLLALLLIGGLLYLAFTHSNQSAAGQVKKSLRKKFDGTIGTEVLSNLWNKRNAPNGTKDSSHTEENVSMRQI